TACGRAGSQGGQASGATCSRGASWFYRLSARALAWLPGALGSREGFVSSIFWLSGQLLGVTLILAALFLVWLVGRVVIDGIHAVPAVFFNLCFELGKATRVLLRRLRLSSR